MQARRQFEVVIVGGGIAGASLAYFLTERGLSDIAILEREAQPGYHATGRSASTLVELDALPALRALKISGGRFLRTPPAGFCDTELLIPCGVVALFEGPAWDLVRELAPALEQEGIALRTIGAPEVLDRVPVLSAEVFAGALLLPDSGHIDVHALLWSYIRHARRRGAELLTGVEVVDVRVEGGRCRGVVTTAGEFQARWVVNAAGAWAGKLAGLAQAAPIAMTPYRRTIVTFAVPPDLDARGWPIVAHEARQIYFAPESGGLLACPMDEDLLEPCDARPDDLVVAQAIERLSALAPRLRPRSLRRSWAGLRTFAPDRVPVAGEDPVRPGFFWLAGQGGAGIETSGALGRIAAELLIDGRTDSFDASVLAPDRFARG